MGDLKHSDLKDFCHDVDVDDERITWRGDAKFTDWTLLWGDTSIPVHRVLLAKSCRFFRASSADSFEGPAMSTDLGKLFPETCRSCLGKFLDWIYEGKSAVESIENSELAPLYLMADVLQCPTLTNHVLDLVQARVCVIDKSETDISLLDAVVAMQNPELFEALLRTLSREALHIGARHIAGIGDPRLCDIMIRELLCRAEQSSIQEFVVSNVLSYSQGERVRSSPLLTSEGMKFRLKVFPGGATNPSMLSAFVEIDPPAGWQEEEFRYEIALVNWNWGSDAAVVNRHTYKFKRDGGTDRGWHDFIAHNELTVEKGWVRSQDSAVKLRFRVERVP